MKILLADCKSYTAALSTHELLSRGRSRIVDAVERDIFGMFSAQRLTMARTVPRGGPVPPK
jgi:hypothetical protein